MNLRLSSNRSRSRSERLYETAATQEGHFTTSQAAEAGYSPQLLAKHMRSGRILRVRRGIYRLVQFPFGDNEDLVVIWLWSAREGVFSHETALALHELSDVLPPRVHLTLPELWRRRRLRVPQGVVLHHDDLADDERTWAGAVPVTSATRTVLDCAADRVEPVLVRQAIAEGVGRGLFTARMVEPAAAYVRSYDMAGA